MVSKLGKAVLIIKTSLAGTKTLPQKFSGAPKTSQRRPQNLPKATFGSKKQANEAQESSKSDKNAPGAKVVKDF